MNRIALVAALALIPLTSQASPRIDIFDANLQPIQTFDPLGAGNQFVRDIEFGPDGHMWVAISNQSHARFGNNPRDVVNRFAPDGSLVATYKAGLRGFVGLAVDPNNDGFWVAAFDEGGEVGERFLYRVNLSDQVVSQSPSLGSGNSLWDIDHTANGNLLVSATHRMLTVDPSDYSIVSDNSTAPVTFNNLSLDPVTGHYIGSTTSGGTSLLRTFDVNGTTVSTTDTSPVGVSTPVYAVPTQTGGAHVFSPSIPSIFQLDYDTLPNGYGSITSSGTIQLARRSGFTLSTDPAGNVYVPTSSVDPITGITASVSPATPGATSTFELSFIADGIIPPDGYIEIEIDGDLDFAGASTPTWEAGGDGPVNYIADSDPWGYYYYYYGGEPDGPFKVGFQRAGGTDIPAGTRVTLSLPGVLNPPAPETVSVNYVHVDSTIDGIRWAEDDDPLPSIEIANGIVCEIGAPFDWDGDGTDEICLGNNYTISDDAIIVPLAQMGDNVTVEPFAYIGADTRIRSGSVIATRARVEDGADLGELTVVSRNSVIEADVHIGADSIIGRSAIVGSNSDLPDSSMVGYGAVVGRHVTVDVGLTLGSLARLGGDASAPGAIDCVGPLIIARDSHVAFDPTYTLNCLGSVTIGPGVSLSSGAVLGDRTRFRKDVQVGAGLTTGSRATLARSATLESSVTVNEDISIGVNSQICTGTVVSESTSRNYIDPACSP